MEIIFVETAVLRDFRTAGENDARVGLQDDVRSAGITAGIVPFVTERRPGKDFLNAEGSFVVGLSEGGKSLAKFLLIIEPDERAVVGNVKGLERAEQSAGLTIADADALLPFDGGLAVFGADDMRVES